MQTDDLLKQIEEKIQDIRLDPTRTNVGIVEEVGDGIVIASGLSDALYGELIEIIDSKGKTIKGLVQNLEEDNVGIIVLGEYEYITQGCQIKTTGKILSVPIGDSLVGRVLNPLCEPLDGKGELDDKEISEIEKIAPGVITREAVKRPLQTGIKSIDAMIPIGRGQRELIIGDRSTGKTSIAIDTIINQGIVAKEEGKDPVICIYCAIGQKNSKVSKLKAILDEYNAMDYTVIVNASASDPTSLQYIAPYTACTIGEYFRDHGRDALVIYDDLTKHAWAYREISLLLKRPSGREAYPGDIFYLHSKLLERAAKLNDENGGGSLTALPIIETQAGDVSAYIPTNLISITDGQIYLEADLFYSGIRPAVNIGLSVSRVGSNAQIKSMKQVAAKLKLDMAQFRDMAAFAQFGSDLDPNTKALLTRGAILTEILKQTNYIPVSTQNQVILILAGTSGFLDKIPLDKIKETADLLLEYLNTQKKDIMDELRSRKEFSDDLMKRTKDAISEYLSTKVIDNEEKEGN